MPESGDEPAPRPRPRPRAKVAGQRKAAPNAAPREAAVAATAAKAVPVKGPGRAAPTDQVPATTAPKRPARPQDPLTRAAAGQAAAAKAAAARKPAATTTASTTAKIPTKSPTKTTAKAAARTTAVTSTARRSQRRSAQPSGINLVLVVLSVLTLLAAAAVTVLIAQRVTTPPMVDPELLPAAEAAYSAMNAFDYTDVEGSVEGALAALTPELREEYEADLRDGVIPAYLEASATARVDNIMVGLQSINETQTEAVVIAYGTKVTKSVNSGQPAPPEGSECAVTEDGADACVLTQQLVLQNLDGAWLVSAVSTITTT